MTDQATISFADKMKAAKLAKHAAAEASKADVAKVKAEVRAKKGKPVGPIKAKGVASVKKSKAMVEKVRKAVAAPAKKATPKEAEKAAKAFLKPKPQAQPTVEGPHGPPTIARSYKRTFSGTGATQRGKMMQITVTFTPDQFSVLLERANLYGASLAETVRKCVIAGPLSHHSTTQS